MDTGQTCLVKLIAFLASLALWQTAEWALLVAPSVFPVFTAMVVPANAPHALMAGKYPALQQQQWIDQFRCFFFFVAQI